MIKFLHFSLSFIDWSALVLNVNAQLFRVTDTKSTSILEYFKKALFNKLSGLVHSSIVPTSLVSTLVRILNMDIYEHG